MKINLSLDAKLCFCSMRHLMSALCRRNRCIFRFPYGGGIVMLSKRRISKPEGMRLWIRSRVLRFVFMVYDSTPSPPEPSKTGGWICKRRRAEKALRSRPR